MRVPSLFAAVCLAASGSAQNYLTLPASAGQEGSTATPMIGSYGEGRIQQIVDGSALCNTRAVLVAIHLRADGQFMHKLAGKKLPSFQMHVGHTSNAAATMQTSFAANRTSAQTRVFSGALDLPAQSDTARPFNISIKFDNSFIYDRSKGELLLELEHPTGGTVAEYPFDAHVQSPSLGSSTPFGVAGNTGQTTAPRVLCEMDFQLRPGGNAISVVSALQKQYPAILFWGFSNTQWGPVPLPLALDGFGAPGNALNVSIDLALPLPVQQSGNTYYARQALPIPNNQGFLGLRLYTQPMLLEPSANAAGLVLLQGLSMNVRAKALNPMQYVQNRDSTSATGFKGNSGESLVIRFEGAFL